MGGTLLQFGVSISVIRSENLPDDMDADDVRLEVRDVVDKALGVWYAARGHELLRNEPMVG